MLNRGNYVFVGDRIELEIRGNFIWVVERIYQKVKVMLKMDLEFSFLVLGEIDLILNFVIIDYYLWDFVKEELGGLIEFLFYKIRIIFY